MKPATFSLAEYDKIIDSGALARKSVEFIDGAIIHMSPQDPLHLEVLRRLMQWSMESLREYPNTQPMMQIPIRLPESDSEPEPDLVWIKKKSYAQAKPTKDDVLLLCEVADSTLDYDLGRKAAIYALGGIQEYWVIDIPRRRIHMHTKPTPDGYGVVAEVEAGEFRVGSLPLACRWEMVFGDLPTS